MGNNSFIKEKSTQAFTMIEIIVVIVILSAMVGLAVPRFNIFMKRQKAQEGKQILIALYGAQKLYYKDNNSLGFASNINNIDITIPAPKYFNAPEVYNSLNLNCTVSGVSPTLKALASISDKDNEYTLYVVGGTTTEAAYEGNIFCMDGVTSGGTCPGPVCSQLGF